MALVLKSLKTLTDPRDSTVELVDIYAVVNKFSEYDRVRAVAIPILDFYARPCTLEERRNGTIVPFRTDSMLGCYGADFDTYFSPASIESDKDQFNRAYAWILQLRDINGDLIYADFESDED